MRVVDEVHQDVHTVESEEVASAGAALRRGTKDCKPRTDHIVREAQRMRERRSAQRVAHVVKCCSTQRGGDRSHLRNIEHAPFSEREEHATERKTEGRPALAGRPQEAQEKR